MMKQTSYIHTLYVVHTYNSGSIYITENNIDWSHIYNCDIYILNDIVSQHYMVNATSCVHRLGNSIYVYYGL